MFIVALFIISRRQQQAKCPSMTDGVIKMCYILIVIYGVATERDEALIHTTTWVSLEYILHKPVTKTIYYTIPVL